MHGQAYCHQGQILLIYHPLEVIRGWSFFMHFLSKFQICQSHDKLGKLLSSSQSNNGRKKATMTKAKHSIDFEGSAAASLFLQQSLDRVAAPRCQ